jgi:hypothetical protein
VQAATYDRSSNRSSSSRISTKNLEVQDTRENHKENGSPRKNLTKLKLNDKHND